MGFNIVVLFFALKEGEVKGGQWVGGDTDGASNGVGVIDFRGGTVSTLK